MNATQRLSELFRPDRDPGTGVLGLVEDVLAYCRDHRVHLVWRPGVVTTRPVAGGPEERMSVTLRGSVFRAAIARLAALCNRGRETPVSPYGGSGEFTDDRSSTTIFRVEFANTPDDQRLELTPVTTEPVSGN
jgi:hypothetical protein